LRKTPTFSPKIGKKIAENCDHYIGPWFQEELLESFSVFDKTGSGFLDREVLEDLIRHQGEGLTAAEIREFLKSIKYNEEPIL
jgi:hypothetical protein